MTATREPLLPERDPRPGDSLLKDDTTWTVERLLRDGSGDVRLRWRDKDEDGSYSVAGSHWQKWAVDAKILKVAP